MDLIHQGEKDESSFFAGVFLTPEGQARQDQLRAKKGTTEFDYDVFLSEAGREREPHKPCLNFDRHCGHCAEHADDEKSIFSGLFRTAAGEEKIVAQKKAVSWDGVFRNPRPDDGSDYDPFPNRTAEEASIQEARKSGSIFDYAGMFKAQRGEVSNE